MAVALGKSDPRRGNSEFLFSPEPSLAAPKGRKKLRPQN